MNIVMHCAGMPFDGNTIMTKSLGGSESAAHYLSVELANKGHNVTLFTNIQQGGKIDSVNYMPIGNINEQSPMGDAFEFYAVNTPHDVLIIQRHVAAFRIRYASKLNYLWLHDVPSKEHAGLINSQMWNINGILTVSEYHKGIVTKAWGVDPDFIHSIENGVDQKLYDPIKSTRTDGVYSWNMGMEDGVFDTEKVNMIYSSRPERGLENLVKKEGIMQQLLERGDGKHHLYVCGYNNTVPQMKEYYEHLWTLCEAAPNVTNLGSLNKSQLASLQMTCDIAVYPTKFEEVSCITAMENMHAGTPMITSRVGAIPETCHKAGVRLVKLKDDEVDINKFINTILFWSKNSETLRHMSHNQLLAAKQHTWGSVSENILCVVSENFSNVSVENKARHFMRKADIIALSVLLSNEPETPILKSIKKEMGLYDFASSDDPQSFEKHYKAYYEYEKNRGVDYGAENLDGNSRFETVSQKIKELYDKNYLDSSSPEKMTVMDYGCAHGHYTINLAKRFPDIEFVGVDIALSNIDKAVKWSMDDKVGNAYFVTGSVDLETRVIPHLDSTEFKGVLFDVVIAAEVIEHVAEPNKHIAALNRYLMKNGTMIITTPYGSWEYIGAREHYPWRAHLHHFERQDLCEIFKGFEGLQILAAISGHDAYGEVIGSYITMYRNDIKNELKEIDYQRKIAQTKGRGTLSVCMLAYNCEDTLRKTLNSVVLIADEIIIGIDENTTDRIPQVIADFITDHPVGIAFDIYSAETPTKIGFDAARNIGVEKATGDWIMWIDSDEVLDQPERIPRVLNDVQHTGYAVPQHHFSMEPPGLMKTDLPTRIFRNNGAVRFRGVAHEHPEVGLNKGVPFTTRLDGSAIAHYGYQNETVRRERFNRNISLMRRDREVNPQRQIGQFLWIRDMAQMCQFQYEQTRQVSPEMVSCADEGIELWRHLVKLGKLRYVLDSMEYISSLNRIKVSETGGGFFHSIKIDVKPEQATDLSKVKEVSGFYLNKDDVKAVSNLILNEQMRVL